MMLLLAVGLFATALFTLVYSPRDYLDVRLEVSVVWVRVMPVGFAVCDLRMGMGIDIQDTDMTTHLTPSSLPPPPVDAQGNRPALFLVPVTMAGYLLTLLAKEIVAVDTIEVLQVRGDEMGWDHGGCLFVG